MFSKIIVEVLTRLGAIFVSWALAQQAKQTAKHADEADIDHRLDVVKKTVTEALDGSPITPDQRKKINTAIADFIRGTSNNGL